MRLWTAGYRLELCDYIEDILRHWIVGDGPPHFWRESDEAQANDDFEVSWFSMGDHELKGIKLIEVIDRDADALLAFTRQIECDSEPSGPHRGQFPVLARVGQSLDGKQVRQLMCGL